MNPIGIIVYGVLGASLLLVSLVGLVCLVGLLLGAMVAVGHVVHRGRGDDHLADGADPDEPRTGLASFRWESEPD
jgi:hypothetical protein